ncbi:MULTISPECIES: type II 3-dehydroquinate dehydratase [Ferrimicrobium]|uniref:3-dehydroquinate dehydratase n=1 Tax=Ferrimicrobium acidiphilum TaxID=121039 RepID=A0ABV3XZK1_9ACTN|nr:type II 3-dehydroquinate dehydratase [Ferrimicrobium sp.]MCL5973922.1 3-dehydroquinate dehydratase [Actinomycetota bacterium]
MASASVHSPLPDAPGEGRVIAMVHGPNLNLLGERQPALYGHATLDELVDLARTTAQEHGYDLVSCQTNCEADLIEAIHRLGPEVAALVLNAGAFTHYSWAVADAIAAKNVPTIELHITNPAARESFRTISVLSGVVSGSIAGFGSLGYVLAVEAAILLDTQGEARHG